MMWWSYSLYIKAGGLRCLVACLVSAELAAMHGLSKDAYCRKLVVFPYVYMYI